MDVDPIRALAATTALSAACYAFFVTMAAIGMRRRSHDSVAPSGARPPVSILKPCAGADEALESCLESFCALEYAAFEVLCGVREADDPATAVIDRVRARYPRAAIRLVITAAGRSPNPKVAQLEVLAASAHHDLLWISDSNTRVAPGALTSMVEDLCAPGVGLVVSPVAGVGERSAGAALENVHLNGFVAAAAYAIYAATGLVAAPGKSALIRRASLESIGGFTTLGRYCAEDNVLVQRVRANGERVVLGREVVLNVNALTTIARFAERQTRWAQLRWVMVPGAVLFELLLAPVVPASAYFLAAPSWRAAAVLALVAAAQCVADLALAARVRLASMAVRHAPLALLRPFVLAWVLARSAFRRRVVWRGNVRWIGPQSLLLDEPPMRARVRLLAAGLRRPG